MLLRSSAALRCSVERGREVRADEKAEGGMGDAVLDMAGLEVL